jgi:ACS family hexuronate transporter-like MFS transporter
MATTAPVPQQSRFRWTICALLFLATTINYVDRQVLSILAKTLETTIGWTNIEYGYIAGAFQATYGLGLLMAGRMMDRLGTRIGFAIAVTVWSLAAMAHAAAVSALTFGVARALLGFGEAANFPACIKTVAEWFPKRERALATGIFNSGTNLGNAAAALAVPAITALFGWRAAFISTGLLGFLWLAVWLAVYRKPEQHSRVSPQELALIQSDPPDRVASVPWMRLVGRKETWAFAMGKALTDPIWWFYLFWLPKYLQETFGLTLQQIIVPTLVVYNVASIGSLGGGWLSGSLLNRGWSPNAARKTALGICAACAVPVLYAPFSKELWVVVGLVGLYTAAHQGFSANLFTLASDMFPRAAVGSVVGIGGTAGAVTSVVLQIGAGYIVQLTGSYLPLFLISGAAYAVALTTIQILSPRLEPAQLD